MASASYAAVLTDEAAAAALACASDAAVLADGAASAALAFASYAVVLAHARAPAFSTRVLLAAVRAFLVDLRLPGHFVRRLRVVTGTRQRPAAVWARRKSADLAAICRPAWTAGRARLGCALRTRYGLPLVCFSFLFTFCIYKQNTGSFSEETSKSALKNNPPACGVQNSKRDGQCSSGRQRLFGSAMAPLRHTGAGAGAVEIDWSQLLATKSGSSNGEIKLSKGVLIVAGSVVVAALGMLCAKSMLLQCGSCVRTRRFESAAAQVTSRSGSLPVARACPISAPFSCCKLERQHCADTTNAACTHLGTRCRPMADSPADHRRVRYQVRHLNLKCCVLSQCCLNAELHPYRITRENGTCRHRGMTVAPIEKVKMVRISSNGSFAVYLLPFVPSNHAPLLSNQTRSDISAARWRSDCQQTGFDRHQGAFEARACRGKAGLRKAGLRSSCRFPCSPWQLEALSCMHSGILIRRFPHASFAASACAAKNGGMAGFLQPNHR